MGYFELTISTCALCMNDTLWYTFAVEMGQQVNQMEVLQQKRAILPNSLGTLRICADWRFQRCFLRAKTVDEGQIQGSKKAFYPR